jgi:CHAT domain-containing protein
MRSVARRGIVAGVLLLCASDVQAQVTYEERDGIRYQVTRRVTQRQVPTTVMQDRQQTVYAQQVSSQTLNHQQLYCVPSTSYQWDTRLHGRWNPFVTPYWTYDLKPVTTWSTQVANVQIPVNQVGWVPQTKTVQVPVTTYRTAQEETVTRVAVGASAPAASGLAHAQPLRSQPTATIAARPSTVRPSTARPSTPLGGVALENDPPRQATGWQQPGTLGNRY